EVRKQKRERAFAQVSVAFGEALRGDVLGSALVHAGVFDEPVDQRALALFLEKPFDDCVLRREVELPPAFTEALLCREDASSVVALQAIALRVLEVEATVDGE